jgi:hypothetical protein
LYLTELCIQEKDTKGELDPTPWRALSTLVYLSNANRAKDGSIVIQVANEAKTVVCVNRLKYEKLQTIDLVK